MMLDINNVTLATPTTRCLRRCFAFPGGGGSVDNCLLPSALLTQTAYSAVTAMPSTLAVKIKDVVISLGKSTLPISPTSRP